jgi:AcrR family transcriptional regulator
MDRSASTRERLLDAAERIIREQGIMAVTTKDIARESGYAEATLYRHFKDKDELMLAVMDERISGHFLQLIRELPGRAGTASVGETLEELVSAAVEFFSHTMPLTVALSAAPELAARHYARLRELGVGPDAARRSVAAYIEAEQRLGRVRAAINPNAVASILLGVSFNEAEVRHVAKVASADLPSERFALEIVRTLMTGLAPGSVMGPVTRRGARKNAAHEPDPDSGAPHSPQHSS